VVPSFLKCQSVRGFEKDFGRFTWPNAVQIRVFSLGGSELLTEKVTKGGRYLLELLFCDRLVNSGRQMAASVPINYDGGGPCADSKEKPNEIQLGQRREKFAMAVAPGSINPSPTNRPERNKIENVIQAAIEPPINQATP
jgi:hypothetical protein